MVRLAIPCDLVEEILSRVPVTSLRQLRFTWKRWNSLFKDPKFIKKQLDKAPKKNLVLMLNDFRVYKLSVSNLKEIRNQSVKFTAKLSRSSYQKRKKLSRTKQDDITEVCHCNGLLLCSTKKANKTKLMIVNPCTGQTRWIEVEPRSVYHTCVKFALGYENNKSYDSYKILRFPNDCKQLKIFELKYNSWRALANTTPKVGICTSGSGVSLNGNTYWISCLLFKLDILSFDFTTERFRHVCLPRQEHGLIKTIALSVFREEKLLVLRKNLDTKQMEIWVSNKIDDIETVFSWINFFTSWD